jgi:hypothetical protein
VTRNSTPATAESSWAFYQGFDWFPARLDTVTVGDIHANTGGSVTAVITGPRKLTDSHWKDVAADEVLIRCGRDFSMKAKGWTVVIIGRLRPHNLGRAS